MTTTDSNLMVIVLASMQREVYETTKANGWYDEDRTFGDDIALLHSEVSEMFEAYRDHEMITWFEHKEGCVHVPLNDLHDTIPDRDGCTCHPKPHGAGPEAGDLLTRLLDTCHRYDIDLALGFQQVSAHNKTRGYKHGGKAI